MKLFVYGTLKKGHGNHGFLENAVYLCDAKTTTEFSLYVQGIPFMVVEKSSKGVYGEIYEVNEEELERIDQLEGHPTCYKRMCLVVKKENGEIEYVAGYKYPISGIRHYTKIEDGIYRR